MKALVQQLRLYLADLLYGTIMWLQFIYRSDSYQSSSEQLTL